MLQNSVHILNERVNNLTTNLKKIEIQKVDATNSKEELDIIHERIDKIHNDLDKKESKIQTVERFIDRYVPIRIQS